MQYVLVDRGVHVWMDEWGVCLKRRKLKISWFILGLQREEGGIMFVYLRIQELDGCFVLVIV